MKTRILVIAACIGLATPGLVLAAKGEGDGNRIQQRFERLDLDSNGRVTLEELKTVREKRIARADADGDGAVTLEELQEASKRQSKHGARMFERMDLNDDGKVTVAESSEVTTKWFENVDKNGDGGITIGELQQWRPGGPGKKGDGKEQN